MRLSDIYLTEGNDLLNRVQDQLSDATSELGGWQSKKIPVPLQKEIQVLMQDAKSLANRDTSYGENRPKKSEQNAIKRRADAIEAKLEKLHD